MPNSADISAGYILAIDQGTTSSRTILVDHAGKIAAEAYQEFPQHLPCPGWVEHDPEEIWQSVLSTINKAAAGRWAQIRGIGITNQRETTIVWSRQTGKPVHRAIVWQDRRTAGRCEELAEMARQIRQKTGLVPDAYFSATKIEWILNHLEAPDPDLCFGTIDSWLIWKLTGGALHVTDYTNASRTMLFDIHRRLWDPQLLELFHISQSMMPRVCSSSGIIGQTSPAITGGFSIPIAGIAGDQQAALFGQRAWKSGQAKITYGTGAFLLLNLGQQAIDSQHQLLLTLACDELGEPCYALEGSIFVAGAAVQWLRDQLGLIESSAECEAIARSLPDNGGVYLVPAFVGLGAPYWRSDVRGAIFGLTRGASKAHFVRAALESIAYQAKLLISAMEKDTHQPLSQLNVDGGASRNDWLMQFQADLLGRPVVRGANVETTAIGAAYLAGLGVGFWKSTNEIGSLDRGRTFEPEHTAAAQENFEMWQSYVRQLLGEKNNGPAGV